MINIPTVDPFIKLGTWAESYQCGNEHADLIHQSIGIPHFENGKISFKWFEEFKDFNVIEDPRREDRSSLHCLRL